MKKRNKNVRIPAWAGLLGLLGFLGLIPPFSPDPQNSQYFFFIFFSFFAWFFWAPLTKEQADERLLENQKRAAQIMMTLFCLLSFLLLFALSKGVEARWVLLSGSLGYAACMVLSPALVLWYDRRED